MPRRLKSEKPYIVVFCEGESEQAYTDFLRKEFQDVAAIKRPGSTGLFEEADSKFKKDKRYRDYAEVTDEIWFFFDVETKDIAEWENRMKIVKRLRSLRKKPNIKVRLLMTTGCIEYWLMLHYEMFVPSIQTVEEKRRIMAKLLTKVPDYEKGNLNQMLGILAAGRVDVKYIYSFVIREDRAPVMVVQTDDYEKAERILKEAGVKLVGEDEL